MARSLVTGAAKRLGREMAIYLAGRGHDVAVHYSGSADAAREVVDTIRAMGRNGVALRADFLDERQIERLLPKAAEALGGPATKLGPAFREQSAGALPADPGNGGAGSGGSRRCRG